MSRTDLRAVVIWMFGCLALMTPTVAFAADLIVGVNVPASRQKPLSAIDHGAWDSLLHTYVDAHGMVNYLVWKHSSRRVFYVSPILQWFGEDFGGSDAARLKRIAAWNPDPQVAQIAARGRGSLDFLEYDWGLNERK